MPCPIFTPAQIAAQSNGKQIKSKKAPAMVERLMNIRAERLKLRFRSSPGIAATLDASFKFSALAVEKHMIILQVKV
jgi:hypothetical protein